MNSKILLASAVLPLAICSCSKEATSVQDKKHIEIKETAIVVPNIVNEIEPNNHFKEATPLKLSQTGQGYIVVGDDGKGDADWWSFKLEDKAQVKIELSGLETIDLAFSLHDDRDPSEAVIKAFSNSDSDKEKLGKDGEVYPAVVLDKGKYYVKVFQFKKRSKDKDLSDSANPYNLTVTSSALAADMEQEPNERAVDASLLPIGESRFGYLGVKNDHDWWRVQVPEELGDNRVLRVTLKAPAKVKPALYLKNDIEAVLKEIGAIKDGGETLVIPAYILKEGREPLYVDLFSRWTHNSDEKYELMAELLPVDVNMEEESNDRPVEATLLNESMFIRGYIDQGKLLDKKPWRQADEDWYKLELPEEKAIMVTLSGLEGVDLVLAMYNPDGSRLLMEVNDNEKKEGEVIAPVWMKEALFKVSAKNSSQFNVDNMYELQVRPYEIQKAIEREPNGSRELATELELGEEGGRHGWLNPKNDVDVYHLDMNKYGAGTYRVKVTGIPVVPLKVTVFNQDGIEIQKVEKTMDKDPVYLEVGLDEGDYFVHVEHGGKSAISNPRDPYTISVIRGNN